MNETAHLRTIPRGKGMAGLAWERNEPVRAAAGDVRAVVGIAYRDEKALSADELRALEAAAARLP